MRIALIRRRYTPHGGAERYVMNLSRRLVKLGHEVYIFSHSWPEGGGVKLHPVPLMPGWGVWELVSFNVAVKGLIRKNRFDVVQSFEKTTCQDVYRAGEGCHREWLLQRKRFEPFFNTLGVRINPFHWLTLALERRLFEKSGTKFFIANSQRGKKEILNHYQVDPKRIEVLYNAVPADRPLLLSVESERAGVRDKNQKIILFVGSGFQRKGLYFLIEALPLILKEADIHLLVVGRGNRDKALRLAEKLGVGNRLTFTGPVDDTTPYYRKADLFVLPSIYEPFSNACLEAMAFDLPIVTTAMNGSSEDIIPGENGFIINDPSQVNTLAEAVFKAFTLKREEVQRCHRDFLARHTWERHLESLLQTYTRVTSLKIS